MIDPIVRPFHASLSYSMTIYCSVGTFRTPTVTDNIVVGSLVRFSHLCRAPFCTTTSPSPNRVSAPLSFLSEISPYSTTLTSIVCDVCIPGCSDS